WNGHLGGTGILVERASCPFPAATFNLTTFNLTTYPTRTPKANNIFELRM
ncbi:MAG: hypothetical protein F6K20_12505, partial [Moorea sp. SIO2C4]|nr:hypothetical protein [Moorena sp. SIO2C4]